MKWRTNETFQNCQSNEPNTEFCVVVVQNVIFNLMLGYYTNNDENDTIIILNKFHIKLYQLSHRKG